MLVGRSSVKLGHVASQALLLVDPQARRRRIELVDAVSDFAGDHWAWADEERLRQILLNLLGNAIKFTEPGGQVILSAGAATEPSRDAELDRSNGPWVYFRVEDTGPGIAADHMERIFEPFTQVEQSSTRSHGGTGLGLAISRRLARLMDGDVTVRSESGVGSSFFLWLPAAPRHDPEPLPHRGAPTAEVRDTLKDVRDAVLSELERILHTYVARLRSDPETPAARELPEPELEDHLASFLADIAQTLGGMDLTDGPQAEALHDGSAIQRTIAERHGRQRARLGWQESELRREFAILLEELAAAVRRRLRKPREGEVEEAIRALGQFIERAELVAVASFNAQRGS